MMQSSLHRISGIVLFLNFYMKFCQPQCTTISSFYNRACYWTISSDVTWIEGETQCRANNGTMAIVESKEVQDFMISQLGSSLENGKKYWIGLTDQEQEGFQVWTNGRPLVWSELQGGSNTEPLDCSTITKAGKWGMADCAGTHPVICQLPRSPCGTQTYFNGSTCFWRTIASVSDTDWEGALQACFQDGGSLLVIPDAKLETFVSDAFQFNKFQQEERAWIAIKRNADQKWAWWRHPVVQIELLEAGSYNKEPNEQSFGNEDCVMMYQDRQWHDWPCAETTHYICQRTSTEMCQTVNHGQQGACYWLLDAPYPWGGAQEQCKLQGGMLAVLRNDDDADFMKIHLQLNDSSEFHIGLRMVTSTHGFWLTGDLYNTSPLGAATDCGYLQVAATSQIAFGSCTQSKRALCMRASVPCTTNSAQGSCFWRVTSFTHNVTWHGARDDCAKYGGSLAVVNSAQKLQYLKDNDLLRADRPPLWIGLSDEAVESVFRWADGAPNSFELWAEGSSGPHEPNGGNTQNCVILTNDGFFKDVPCDETHEFLCQIPGVITCTNPADGCSTTPGPSTKSCIKLYNTSSNWELASQTCKTWGNGTLAKVSSAADNSKVQGLLRGPSWIGANSKAILSLFRWTWDNYVLTWANWDTGEPRDPEVRCVAMQQDGKWQPQSCSSAMPFVCQAKPENLCEFAPKEIAKGSTTYSLVKIKTTTAQYKCPPGYIVPSLINTGDPDVQEVPCVCPGPWDDALLLECIFVDCGSPTPVQFTTPLHNTTYHGSTAIYKCVEGYHNPGQSVLATRTPVTCKANGDWSAVPPQCEIIDCGQPNPVDHSTRKYTSTVYNSDVTYTCDTGYFIDAINLIPSKTVKCTGNGTWDTNVECTVIDCGPLPNITYADMVFENGTYYSSAAHYKCHHFFLFPDLMRVNAIWCNASGQWTELGTCKSLWEERRAKGCSQFKDDNSFRVTFHNDGKYDYANINCREGYKMADSTRTRAVYCLNTMQWEMPAVLCHREPCTESLTNQNDITTTPEPWDITENEVKIHPDKYSDQKDHSCDAGLRVQSGLDEVNTRCLGKYGWVPYLPTCTERCPPPPFVEGSSIISAQNESFVIHPGRKYEVKCFEGYLFPDGRRSAPLSCSAKLEWKYTQDGNCGRDRCPALQIPTNATADKDIALFGTVITVECEYAFKFPDNDVTKKTTCTASRTWDPILVDCIEIICPVPPLIANSRKTGDGQKYENVIRYDCAANRRTEEGERFKEITCLLESQWSETKFTCEVGRCEPPPSVPFSKWRRTVDDGRSPIIYECLPGYLFFPANVTEMTATCDDTSAKWRMPFRKCEPLYCPSSPIVANSSRNSTRMRFMDVVGYSCDFGFWTTNGSFSTVCTVNGTWSDTLQECQLVECGSFPKMINSSATEVNGTFFFQDSLNVSCDPGFWFRRGEYHRVIECDGDAKYKPLESKCGEITCPDLPVWTGVVSNTSEVSVGTIINMTCNVNMTLSTFELFEFYSCDEEGNWMPTLSQCIDVPKPKAEKVTKEAESAQAVGTVAMIIMFLALGLIVLLDVGVYAAMGCFKFKKWYQKRKSSKIRSKPLGPPEETPAASPIEEMGTKGVVPVNKPLVPPPPVVFQKESTINNFTKAQLTFSEAKNKPEETVTPLDDVTELDVG